jgi:glycosyltransferase involved in cell wall biosynthesis
VEGRRLSREGRSGLSDLYQAIPQLLASVEAAIPAMDAAGIEHSMVWEVGCPYVSHARATMLRKALDWGAEAIVFLDHDLSFEPEGLLKLIEAEGPVVSGLYRFKKDDVEYMGILRENADGTPFVREDGCIRADKVPAGFLKITREAVDTFMKAYPELIYGVRYNPSVDLFNHGAHEGVWYGEDYSFSRRWRERRGDLGRSRHQPDASFSG